MPSHFDLTCIHYILLVVLMNFEHIILKESMKQFRDANSHLISNTKPGKRKSVAEAIEEIINPVFENLQDVNRYCNASPDVSSMDGKTLVNRDSFFSGVSTASSQQGTVNSSTNNSGRYRSSTIADNINFALGGAINENWDHAVASRSDSSNRHSSSRSKCTDDGSSHESTRKIQEGSSPRMQRESMPVSRAHKSNELLSSDSQYPSGQNPPSVFDGPNNHLRPVPLRQHSAPTGTSSMRPTSRIDLPPNSSSDIRVPESPILAPRSRREVAPDFELR